MTVPTGDLFAWHRALRSANTFDEATKTREVVLSRQALALAFVLGTYMNHDGITPARYSPSLNTLSHALGYAPSDHRKAVTVLLRELVAAGYLVVTTRVGHFTPNLYTAVVPATLASRAAAPDAGAEGNADPAEGRADSTMSTNQGRRTALSARVAEVAQVGAAFTPQITDETAVPTPDNCGVDAAHPSSAFSPPSPAGGSSAEHRGPSPASRVLFRAVEGLSPAETEQLMASIATFRHRAEMARRIEALCEAGAEEKIVHELARPYTGAKNPAAVAAGRVRDLHAAFGRPRA